VELWVPLLAWGPIYIRGRGAPLSLHQGTKAAAKGRAREAAASGGARSAPKTLTLAG
jgi:hypothetical protein